jgi:hypothetical protein
MAQNLFDPMVGGGFPLSSAGDFSQFVTVLPAELPLSAPPPNDTETARLVQPTDTLLGGRTGDMLIAVNPAVLRDTSGNVIVPSSDGTYINLGNNHTLDFDPNSFQGKITPALSGKILDDLSLYLGDAPLTYTGSDVRVMLEVADPPQRGDASRRTAKQLLECTTLSVSVHRAKSPVRAFGYVNPKGFARGSRTIAGTLVMTQFTVDVFLRFLQQVTINEDLTKDEFYSKTDQIPPLNMTLFFSNEQGFASFRRLLGVELVTDGVVHSIQDMLSEQSITYYAADLTPLMPLTMSSLYAPTEAKARRERTVQDVWANDAANIRKKDTGA